MTILKPICYNCKHLVRNAETGRAELPWHCAAFPKRIAMAIIDSEADHRQPFPGDHGIQFEAANDHGDAYAAMIFGDHKAGEDRVVDKPVINVDAQPHNANWLKRARPAKASEEPPDDHVWKGPREWK